MQRQPQQDEISRRSRGILYNLKSNIFKSFKSLDNYIAHLFGYFKESFKKNQFQLIIKYYDNDLIYQEIDKLFNELDDNKNGYVFLYRLKEVYVTISQEDNVKDVMKSSIKSKIFNVLNISQSLEDNLKQLRCLLLGYQDLYEVIEIFDDQKKGFLNVSNFIQLLKMIEYQNQAKCKSIIGFLFENKNNISIQNLIKKLDLEPVCKRINMKKIKENKNNIKNSFQKMDIQHPKNSEDVLRQSRFIQQNLRESIKLENSISYDEELQQSLHLDLKTIKSSQQFINIEKIPQILQPYYNYGSVLSPQFSLIASEYLKKNQLFIDPNNPPYSKAHKWRHVKEIKGEKFTLFKVNESVIYRDKNRKELGQLLESKDIQQGRLGDCYFLSALSAVVEKYPELVYRLFVLDKNPAHIYGLRLFIDGKWQTIVLDACFPFAADRMLCAAQSYNDQIWVMLLEKAWAKAFHSYDNIHSGYNEEGLNACSGAPSVPCSSRQEGFLKKLEAFLKKGAIITCASSPQVMQMTDQQQDNLGIYSNHAYTLLSVHSHIPYNGGKNLTLIRIRNPWGRKQWKGDWSYYSSLWKKQLKDLLNYNKNPKDGSFYMNYQNFMMYFDFVNICQVNLAYINCYLSFESNRNQFNVISFKIKEKGDYFFTQYQQNPRKYKNLGQYKKSKAWMYLIKCDGGFSNKNGKFIDNSPQKRTAIGCHGQQYKDNTLEVSLTPGDYIIISKVAWNYWQSHNLTLTSYGPQNIELRLDRSRIFNPDAQISKFIESSSQLWGLGKIQKYDQGNITKRLYFEPVQGYGFMAFFNMQRHKILNTQIKMMGCKGLQVLSPHSLPLKLSVLPGEKVIVKFIVDPSGFAYQYSQNYYLEG